MRSLIEHGDDLVEPPALEAAVGVHALRVGDGAGTASDGIVNDAIPALGGLEPATGRQLRRW